MKLMLFTNDPKLEECLFRISAKSNNSLIVHKNNNNPLDIISSFYITHPSILIADDDFLKPATGEVLKSIRKMNKEVAIIFTATNISIELGREISRLGIHFYAVKPIREEDLLASIESIGKLQITKSLQ